PGEAKRQEIGFTEDGRLRELRLVRSRSRRRRRARGSHDGGATGVALAPARPEAFADLLLEGGVVLAERLCHEVIDAGLERADDVGVLLRVTAHDDHGQAVPVSIDARGVELADAFE